MTPREAASEVYVLRARLSRRPPRGRSVRLFLSTPAIVMILLAGSAAAGPLTAISRDDSGKSSIAFAYSKEEIRQRFDLDKLSRGIIVGTIRLALPAGAGFCTRARAAGPWTEDDSTWLLTDLDFGPSWGFRDRWGRFDLDGWLTIAAPAGKTPQRDPWYGGLRKWSYGPEVRVAARALGGGSSASIWLGFGLGYRSQGRSYWVYLPHHSVAIADSAGGLGGSVITWQARVEFRGERATIATSVLQENLVDAGALLAEREEPLYIVQSASLRAWRGVGILASGEFLLSGDDKSTAYSARSVLPSWSVTFGLSWEYPLWPGRNGPR